MSRCTGLPAIRAWYVVYHAEWLPRYVVKAEFSHHVCKNLVSGHKRIIELDIAHYVKRGCTRFQHAAEMLQMKVHIMEVAQYVVHC